MENRVTDRVGSFEELTVASWNEAQEWPQLARLVTTGSWPDWSIDLEYYWSYTVDNFSCGTNLFQGGEAPAGRLKAVASRLSPVGTYEVEECTLVEKSCTVIENCAGDVPCTGPTDAKCSECEPGFSGDDCAPTPAPATSHHESMGQFGSLLDRMDTYLSSKGFR